MEISSIHKHRVLFAGISLDVVHYNEGFREIAIKPLDYIVHSASLRSFLHSVLLRYFRFRRRLEMIADLGTTWGKKLLCHLISSVKP